MSKAHEDEEEEIQDEDDDDEDEEDEEDGDASEKGPKRKSGKRPQPKRPSVGRPNSRGKRGKCFIFTCLSPGHPHVEVEYERETEPLTAEQLSQW